jgi:hypothetical protein
MPITPIEPDGDHVPLLELIEQIEDGSIQVNPKYQRSGQIWPARAKSFLVETVLIGMPIPRVLLHSLANPNPPHHSDIIDGQQRCSILVEFRADRFALTTDVDDENLHGKRFSNLSSREQNNFDGYSVPIDRYAEVTPKQIRQVFRRLNYYTAALNAAEQRHAQFYGELSRFIEEETALWQPVFAQMRAFTKRQLARKADEQLMAEIVDAMLNGISTTTAKSLRDVYGRYERQFPSAPDFRRKLKRARDQVSGWGWVRGGPLTKHYQLFGMILGVIHATGDLASLRSALGPAVPLRPEPRITHAFASLSTAIREKVDSGAYAKFWAASHEKTNVKENRTTRCKYFYRALTGAEILT